MKIYPKSTHELAAQAVDTHLLADASFDPKLIPNGATLAHQFTEQKAVVLGALKSRVSEGDLREILDNAYAVGDRVGVVAPVRGPDSEQILRNVNEQFSWDPVSGMRAVQRSGYLGALRNDRRMKEWNFAKPIKEFVGGRQLDREEEDKRVEALRDRVIDISAISPEQHERLEREFPGGNFLFHSAATAELIKIFDTGALRNFKAIDEAEARAAEAEGRKRNFTRRNSGWEGISWSMNELDAVPGDRFHIAGFVAAPDAVLREDQQLAIPSRPAPFEVIQIDSSIDAEKFYTLKVQSELYQMRGLGEVNSVLGNVAFLRSSLKPKDPGQTAPNIFMEPMLSEFIGSRTDEEIAQLIKDSFEVRDDGSIELSPSLYQQKDGPDVVPVGAAWMQGLIDSGRIKQIPGFEDAQNVRDIVTSMTYENATGIIRELTRDITWVDERFGPEMEKVGDLEVPVKDMYFIAPRKDLQKWMAVLARTAHKPKGILLYDSAVVRMEDFANLYGGDSGALTQELQHAIAPDPEHGYIDWERHVLGQEITPDKRGGHNHQVVAERYLSNRRTIRKIDGQLVIV